MKKLLRWSALAAAAAFVALVKLVVLAVVVIGVWLYETPTDHTGDAEHVATLLSGMPGVESVSHDYVQSEGLLGGPGTAGFDVDMAPDATTNQTLAVVGTAYAQFAARFGDDYAALELHAHRAVILVHTRSADVPVEKVLPVARFALDSPAAGERTRTDITADDEPGKDPIDSEVHLGLADGSTVNDIVPRFARVADAGDLPPGTDLWVHADGNALGGSRGLPTDEDIATWQALRSVAAPGSMRVAYGPYSLYDSQRDFGFAVISLHAKPAPTREQLVALRAAQTAIVARHSHTYVYTVFVNRDSKIWLQRRGQ